MKSFLNSTVLALALTLGTVCAQAENAGHSSIITHDGTWAISERVCSDGTPANDRYDFGRDSMTLTLNANRGTLEVRIDDRVQATSVEIYAPLGQISYLNSEGRWDGARYELIDTKTLIVTSEGFGEGGSCAVGQKLYSTFKKTN